MNLFISCDIEGVAGVVDREQCQSAGKLYNEARALMAGELNAAIEGALEAGAKRIVVNDSHGAMCNLSPEAVHPAAELILGSVKTMSMTEGLDKSFNAAAFIGYHARAGTRQGVLAHTYFGVAIREVRLNGKPMGEAGINGAAAGAYGVPLVFLSGDQTVAREIRGLIPGIAAVTVKRGLGRRSSQNLHPEKARERIRAGMASALSAGKRPKPFLPRKPHRLEVDVFAEEMADYCMRIPCVTRRGANTVAFRSDDYLETYRALLTIITMAGAAMR